MSKIVRNPEILLGKPTIEGTRISVELILNLFASKMSFEEILRQYPHLTEEDIQIALEYAAKKMSRLHPDAVKYWKNKK